MKILQVIPYYPPAESFGGPPQVFYSLGKELIRRGHQVSVYTTDVSNIDNWAARINEDDATIDGISVHRFNRLWYSRILPNKFFRLLVNRIDSHHLQKVSDFDIVHISEITHPLAMVFSSQAKKLGIPYVVSVFGNLTPVSSPLLQFQRKIFDYFLGNKILTNASSLLVQNQHEGEVCSQYTSSEKIVELLLPINIPILKDLPVKGNFRAKNTIGETEKVILYLGRVHRYKGIELIIKSMPELIKLFEGNIRLVIAGTDEGYKDTLNAQSVKMGVKNNVTFLGSTFGQEKLEAFVDADVFAVTPTTWEETSLAALEACSYGIPVIITERNAIPGLEEYHAGYQVPSNSVDELTTALTILLKNDTLRKTTGKNARKLIEDKYTLEKVVDNLESVFTRIVKERKV